MAVSCFSVLKEMISKPKNDNIFWIYILRPFLIIMCILILSAIAYLYLVPFTNIIGMQLFADYKCPTDTGVWQVCGRMNYKSDAFDVNGSNVVAGFFVFLIIQATVGLAIISVILYPCSRRKGYVRKFTFDGCCGSYMYCELPHQNNDWVMTDHDQSYGYGCECQSGPYMYYTSVLCLTITIFLTTIFVGIWVGRYIAVQTVSSCIPYKNTNIGLLGCVNAAGQYVGGQTCNNCAGIGFGILALPVLILEILLVCFYFFIKKCRNTYLETKNKLETENNNKLERIDDNKCRICENISMEIVTLSCNHNSICINCANNDAVTRCPICLVDFKKEEIIL